VPGDLRRRDPEADRSPFHPLEYAVTSNGLGAAHSCKQTNDSDVGKSLIVS
jgi:hypothetical protein